MALTEDEIIWGQPLLTNVTAANCLSCMAVRLGGGLT